jgi:hypothetical protein
MTDRTLIDSRSTAIVEAAIETIDLPEWLFTLPTNEYRRCSPDHIASGSTVAPDGRRMSINVEKIGSVLLIQSYVEEESERTRCRVRSVSDVFNPLGETKMEITWEVSVQHLDDDRCTFVNHIIGRTTPELLDFFAGHGVPLEMAAAQMQQLAATHNAAETPEFARSIAATALGGRASGGRTSADNRGGSRSPLRLQRTAG